LDKAEKPAASAPDKANKKAAVTPAPKKKAAAEAETEVGVEAGPVPPVRMAHFEPKVNTTKRLMAHPVRRGPIGAITGFVAAADSRRTSGRGRAERSQVAMRRRDLAVVLALLLLATVSLITGDVRAATVMLIMVVLGVMLRFLLQRLGLVHFRFFDRKLTDVVSKYHHGSIFRL